MSLSDPQCLKAAIKNEYDRRQSYAQLPNMPFCEVRRPRRFADLSVTMLIQALSSGSKKVELSKSVKRRSRIFRNIPGTDLRQTKKVSSVLASSDRVADLRISRSPHCLRPQL